MNTDEMLKGLARESVKQGENLRVTVRDLRPRVSPDEVHSEVTEVLRTSL